MSKPYTIVGLGEVLWDVFPDAAKFGGAPANFACCTAGLASDQADVYMVSGVGNDALGSQSISELGKRRVKISHVVTLDHVTGKVLVEIDGQGKATYEFVSDTAWDNLTWTAELGSLAAQTDAVCFGTLGQRSEISHQVIHRFLSATPIDGLRIYDINIRKPHYAEAIIRLSLEAANVLKLNDEELPLVADMHGYQGTDIELMKQLATQYELRCVALTRGSEGALLLRGSEFSQLPGIETNVVDTVGAGDAFTASLALGLLGGDPLDQINRNATALAAYVCTQAGATPDIPKRFTNSIS